jgi:Aminomethyltransferase folate-binding domain
MSRPDALRAAQRVFSNDALGLEVAQVRYGAFLDLDGLMVDDGTVFNTAGDHCWVMTDGRDHEEYFGEAVAGLDAQVEWITPSMPHLGVVARARERSSRSLAVIQSAQADVGNTLDVAVGEGTVPTTGRGAADLRHGEETPSLLAALGCAE